MEYLVTKTIPRKELKHYKDYIGFLFKNEDNVFNICDTEEDIMKSNQWFKNFPLKTIVVNEEPIQVGDIFLAICANQDLNGRVFKYLGVAKIGEGLIAIESIDSKEGLRNTTYQLIETSYKFVRKATREDKEKLVNGKISEYAL